jgi:hypothetical protein
MLWYDFLTHCSCSLYWLSLHIRGSVINLAPTEPLVLVFRSLALDDIVEVEDA